MDGKASFVAFAGLGLVAANLWTGPEKAALDQLSNGNFSAGLTALKSTGLELVLIIVATFVAGTGDNAANIMLVLIMGLWLLFLINRFGSGRPATFGSGTTTTSTTPPAKTTKSTGPTLV